VKKTYKLINKAGAAEEFVRIAFALNLQLTAIHGTLEGAEGTITLEWAPRKGESLAPTALDLVALDPRPADYGRHESTAAIIKLVLGNISDDGGTISGPERALDFLDGRINLTYFRAGRLHDGSWKIELGISDRHPTELVRRTGISFEAWFDGIWGEPCRYYLTVMDEGDDFEPIALAA
jgi:hypothetical protein